MFKVSSDPKFTHPVTVCVPVDGGHKNMTFPVTFRVMPLDQLDDGQGAEGQAASLRKVITHMEDLVGDNDQPIPYSDEIRDQLIAVPYVRLALMKTYLEAVTKTKAGN